MILELAYLAIDRGYVLPESRSLVKGIFDQHVLLVLTWICPSVIAIHIAPIYKMMQCTKNASESGCNSASRSSRLTIVLGSAAIFFIGLLVGSGLPVMSVIVLGTAVRGTVISAVGAFGVLVYCVEKFAPSQQQMWLRPLVWGNAIGVISLALTLSLDKWQIDLTV